MSNPDSNVNNGELITLRKFTREMEADIASGALRAFGIECVLSRDDCGGQRPHLLMGVGIRLLVRPEDVEQAEEVLASNPEALT